MSEVVVIGAGVFGVWTAQHLRTVKASVMIVDAYGPANPRSSSGDESRIIRCGYGPDEIYTRWARASLAQWRDIGDRLETKLAPLFYPCGVLWLASGDDPYSLATHRTLQRVGCPVTLLDRESLRMRFPHIVSSDVGVGLFEPDCGVLMARRAVHAMAADLDRRGTPVVSGRVLEPRDGPRLRAVRLTDGRELRGDAFVFACGPWLPKVFPGLLADRIRTTRQVVLYFGSPPGDDRFGPESTPAWVDFAAGIYGVPDVEHRGVKVGLDRHGPPFDPDSGDRIADAASIETARAWLGRRMPGMAQAPVIESRVCQYESTDRGDFLIDRHPAFENVWIAGGGSGHGFKHGPAVGQYVAGLVCGVVEPEPRFALATKGTRPQRSVF